MMFEGIIKAIFDNPKADKKYTFFAYIFVATLHF